MVKFTRISDLGNGVLGRIAQPGLIRNGLFSFGQSLFKLICLFLAYRIFIQEEGLQGLGLWALLMVFSNFAGPVDISGAAALARTVARRDQDHEYTEVATIIHSVLLISIAINLTLGTLVMIALPPLLPLLVEANQLAQAEALVPWLVAVMIFTALFVGVGASLDGLGRADIRAMIVAGSAALQLALTWLLVEDYGIVGFAAATLIHMVAGTAIGWFCLSRRVAGMGWFPHKWSGRVVLSSAAYAMKLNGVGLFSMLLEPVIRFSLNFSGGTLAVGAYELATKLVIQLRGLALAGMSPMVPAFAGARDDQPDQFHVLVRKAHLLAMTTGFTVFLIALAGSPLLSLFMLEMISEPVVTYAALLALAYSINVFALPLFLAGQGKGVLAWNFVSTALPVLGAVLGNAWPHDGESGLMVVFGAAAGIVLGSVLSLLGNGRAMLPVAIMIPIWRNFILLSGLLSLLTALWLGLVVDSMI